MDHAADADFEAAVEYGTKVVQAVFDNEQHLPRPLCLNVNIPKLSLQDIKGLRICRQTRGYWREEFFKREDPNGRNYYWMTGAFNNHEPEAQDSDEWALANGYVSVVPIQMDMTAHTQINGLKEVLK